MLAMLVPNGISRVACATSWHRATPSPKLGQYRPEKPRRSISVASSTVRRRRPGTAAKLRAGFDMRTSVKGLKGLWSLVFCLWFLKPETRDQKPETRDYSCVCLLLAGGERGKRRK